MMDNEFKGLEVFDADNPPSRMSQIIRIGVRDVEAMLAQGYEYDWHSPSLKFSTGEKLPYVVHARSAGHAGAVLLSLSGDPEAWNWDMFGPVWRAALNALSYLTGPARATFASIYNTWPEGFAQAPSFWAESRKFSIPHARTNWTAHRIAMLQIADRLEAEGS